MNHEGIRGDEQQMILNLARKRLAKRSRASSKKEEDDTDGRGDDADGADVDMQDAIAENPFAKSLPEGDLAFALNSIPAGMALDDEEDDEGLDEIAKAAAVLDDVGKVYVPRMEALPSTSVATSSQTLVPVPPRLSTSASGASGSGLPEHLRDHAPAPLAAPAEAPPPPPPPPSPGDALAMIVADEHVAVPDVGVGAGGDLPPFCACLIWMMPRRQGVATSGSIQMHMVKASSGGKRSFLQARHHSKARNRSR